MKKSLQFVKDGTVQSKPECGNSSLFKVIHMYLDMLPKLVKQYNNTKHSSIKMKPIEASVKGKMKELFISICMVIWKQSNI